MDSSVEKQGSGALDPDERAPAAASGETTKACTECHTTKTPLWRGGPHGPMSLCNACGIRYRKKRREAMGLDSSSKASGAAGGTEQQQQRKKKATAAAAAAAASKRERAKVKEREASGEVTVELRAVGFGKDVVLKQRRRMRRRRRSEEERAAFLLMALSSGVVYA